MLSVSIGVKSTTWSCSTIGVTDHAKNNNHSDHVAFIACHFEEWNITTSPLFGVLFTYFPLACSTAKIPSPLMVRAKASV